MKTKFCWLVVLLSGLLVNAQVPSVSENAAGSSTYGGNFLSYADVAQFDKAMEEKQKEDYENIEGSAFLSHEYLISTLLTTDGHTISEVPLKWNIYTQNVIVRGHNGGDLLLDEYKYEAINFTFEGKEILLKRVNNERPNVFYEILFEGPDLMLFKERYVTIKEGKSYGMASSGKKFTARSRYFVMQGKGSAVKTRLKKKSMLALFSPAQVKAMEQYANENNLKLNSEGDFIALFEALYSKE